MSKGLIDERLNNELNKLVGKCFAINRMLDRGLVVPIALREKESFFRELVCELCQLEI